MCHIVPQPLPGSTAPTRDAAPVRYVVEITPLSDGRWVVGTIEAVQRRSISAEAKAAVLARMRELGALVPANPAGYPEAKALEATLGVYRFDPFDCEDMEAGAV